MYIRFGTAHARVMDMNELVYDMKDTRVDVGS